MIAESVIEWAVAFVLWAWFAIGLWTAADRVNGEPIEEQLHSGLLNLFGGPLSFYLNRRTKSMSNRQYKSYK